jgi:uncharacterized membrane protein
MKHEKIDGDGEKEIWYAIHEVYYKDDEVNDLTVTSNDVGYTKEPIEVRAENIDQLRWVLEEMLKSLDKPILDYQKDENA